MRHVLPAGLGCSGMCAHPDIMVPRQGERHLLGLLDGFQQHRRLCSAHPGRHRSQAVWLEVSNVPRMANA